MVQFNDLPTIRAAEVLGTGNSAKALEALKAAAPYELGIPDPTFTLSPYPVYLRGEAYLTSLHLDRKANTTAVGKP